MVHILFPVLYSIFPLYRLSEAFLGLKYILQKCLEFDSTGYVQVSLNSSGPTRRSSKISPALLCGLSNAARIIIMVGGLEAPTPGRIGLDWQYGRPSRTTTRAEL